MHRFLRACALIAASALTLSTAAFAQDGTFIVTNASDFAVVGFQTAKNGKWGKDWIPGDAMLPGEQFQMKFDVVAGDCLVPTLVTFEDNSAFDVDVDFCSVGHLILHNDTIEGE